MILLVLILVVVLVIVLVVLVLIVVLILVLVLALVLIVVLVLHTVFLLFFHFSPFHGVKDSMHSKAGFYSDSASCGTPESI